MPEYDYECQECKTPLQVKASIREKEEGLALRCPECGSERMEQVFLAVSVIGSTGEREISRKKAPAQRGGCGCSGCGCHHG